MRAGHKALYSDEWKGLPDKEFLTMLDPKLALLRTGSTRGLRRIESIRLLGRLGAQS